ncbi:MAG: CotH kinase family protein [Oscillospiraceae bacterium]|nr:CotH kinase family protein [Oscillospiraceae bacterium]
MERPHTKRLAVLLACCLLFPMRPSAAAFAADETGIAPVSAAGTVSGGTGGDNDNDVSESERSETGFQTTDCTTLTEAEIPRTEPVQTEVPPTPAELKKTEAEALIQSISPYYKTYYTDETVRPVKKCLDEWKKTLRDAEPDEEKLTGFITRLKAAADKLTYRTGKVPQIYVTTTDGVGRSLRRSMGYVTGSFDIVEPDGKITGGSGQIKVRGNSTALVLRKPYTIKFDEKKDVLQMGKAKKWALLPNAFDPTMMRNCIAFTLAQKLGFAFSSERQYTELYLDGSYRGCYEIYEPVEVNKERVNISKDAADGEFLIEYEDNREKEGVTYFTITSHPLYRFAVEYPKEPTEEQLAHIQTVTDSCYDVLRTKDYVQIQELIDTESFAKLYLLNEFMKTLDFGMSSVFFYWKEGKLYAGPPWDFDLSAGNGNPETHPSYTNKIKTDGLLAANQHFCRRLLMVPEFRDEVTALYQKHYADFEQIYLPGGLMDQLADEYMDIFLHTHEVWGGIERKYANYMRLADPTYEENMEFLRSWLLAHNAWLSGYYEIFGKPEAPVEGDIDCNGALTLSDAVLLARIIGEVPHTTAPEDIGVRGDLDENGLLTSVDFRLLIDLLNKAGNM